MIDRWKAILRAWLIDLVREAIRLERAAIQPISGQNAYVAQTKNPASNPVTVSEPSFEQMQATAIQEQEKHYAPQQQ